MDTGTSSRNVRFTSEVRFGGVAVPETCFFLELETSARRLLEPFQESTLPPNYLTHMLLFSELIAVYPSTCNTIISWSFFDHF